MYSSVGSSRKSGIRGYLMVILILVASIGYFGYRECMDTQLQERILEQRKAAAELEATAGGNASNVSSYFRRKRRELRDQGEEVKHFEGAGLCVPIPPPPEGFQKAKVFTRTMAKDTALRNLYQKHFRNRYARLNAKLGFEFARHLGKYCKSGICSFNDDYFKYGHNLKFHELFYCEKGTRRRMNQK